jgi:hypothetical protein
MPAAVRASGVHPGYTCSKRRDCKTESYSPMPPDPAGYPSRNSAAVCEPSAMEEQWESQSSSGFSVAWWQR